MIFPRHPPSIVLGGCLLFVSFLELIPLWACLTDRQIRFWVLVEMGGRYWACGRGFLIRFAITSVMCSVTPLLYSTRYCFLSTICYLGMANSRLLAFFFTFFLIIIAQTSHKCVIFAEITTLSHGNIYRIRVNNDIIERLEASSVKADIERSLWVWATTYCTTTRQAQHKSLNVTWWLAAFYASASGLLRGSPYNSFSISILLT